MHNIANVSGYYNTDKLVAEAIKKISRVLLFHPLPKLYPNTTCVVVGSSGVLLQYPGLGKTIDSYDYVIRINFAPTAKFEQYVGSKISLHFAYLRSCLLALEAFGEIKDSHILYGG